MAKKNQVTKNLKISAEVALEHSRDTAKKIDELLEHFDFGDRINKQFITMKNNLVAYSKILQKTQSHSLVTEKELKDIEKAGDGIVEIEHNVERLYKSFDSTQLQRFTKEFIAAQKEVERDIAKLKQEFAQEMGIDFDISVANLDKTKERITQLRAELEAASKITLDSLKAENLAKLNSELNETVNKIEILQKAKAAGESAYNKVKQNILKQYGATEEQWVKTRKPTEAQTIVYKQNKQFLEDYNNLQIKIKETQAEINQYTDKNGQQLENLTKKEQARLITLQKQKKELNNIKQEQYAGRIKETQAAIKKYEESVAITEARRTAATERDVAINTSEGITTQSGQTGVNRQLANLFTKQNTILQQIAQADDDTQYQDTIQSNEHYMQQIENEVGQLVNNTSKTEEYQHKIANRAEDLKDIGKEVGTEVGKNVPLDEAEKNINDNTNKDGEKTRSAFHHDEMAAAGQTLAITADRVNSELLHLTFEEQIPEDIEKQIVEYREKIFNATNRLTETPFDIDLILELRDLLLEIEKFAENDIGNLIPLEFENDGLNEDYYDKLRDSIKGIKNNFLPGAEDLDRIYNDIKNTTPEVEQASQSTEKMAQNIHNAANESRFLGSTIQELSGRLMYFFSANYLFDLFVRKIREAAEAIRAMDKDMTQIGLVLGKTSRQAWKSFDTYADMASRLNTTVADVTSSMKLFYQQGLNTSQVNKMVEASAIAAALGETSMAEASETLTSIINSYNLSASEALSVTDKISQVAIVSAADFNEISTAIEKVAASASSAGLDIDHMMGYLAKMIETTREAPTNIGTALKTIVANMAKFKEDPSSANEEGFTANDVDRALKTVGISLLDAQGQIRDLGDVLDELGAKWESLTRNQKSYIATMIAGTRQQSRFYALMNDYDRTLELVNASLDSDGKATSQFALYTQSLEAATNRLNNEWQKFYNALVQSGSIIVKVTNLGTGLLKIVNLLSKSSLGSSPLTPAWGMIKGVSTARNFISQYKLGQDTQIDSDAFKQLSQPIQDYFTQIEEINKHYKSVIPNAEGFNKVLANTKKSGEIAGAGLKLVGAGLKAVAVATVKAMATMWAITLAMKAIAGIVKGVTKALGLNVQELKEQADQYQENAKTVTTIREEYESLAKKINKTEEEYKRLNELVEEAAKVDKELGIQLKANGDNYAANLKILKEYADMQERLAGEKGLAALRGETNLLIELWQGIKSIPMLFGGGKKGAAEAVSTNLKSSLLTGATSFSRAHNLNDEQSAIIERYTAHLIDINDESAAQLYKLGRELESFLDKELDNLTADTIQEYQRINEILANDQLSYRQQTAALLNTTLPKELRDIFLLNFDNRKQSAESSMRMLGLSDNAIGILERLFSIDELSNLFTPDESSLTKEELVAYQADIKDLIQDSEFIQAFQEGGNVLREYLLKQEAAGKIAESTAYALYQVKTAAEQLFEIQTSFEKLSKITDILTGNFTQMQILEKMINGELAIGSVQLKQFSDGTSLLVPNISALIEEYQRQKEILLKPYNESEKALQIQLESDSASFEQYKSNLKQESIRQAEQKRDLAIKELAESSSVLENVLKYASETGESALKSIQEPNTFENHEHGGELKEGYDNTIAATKEAIQIGKDYNQELKNIEENINNIAEEDWKNVIEEEKNAIKETQNYKKVIEDILNKPLNALKDNFTVFDSLQTASAMGNELKSLREASQASSDSIWNFLDMAQMMLENPDLINYIDLEAEAFEFSQEKLEEAAANKLKVMREEAQAKLDATDIILQALQGESDATIDTSENATEALASIISGELNTANTTKTASDSIIDATNAEQNAFVAMGNAGVDAYQRIQLARNDLIRAMRGGANQFTTTAHKLTENAAKSDATTITTEDIINSDGKIDLEKVKSLILDANDGKDSKDIIKKYQDQRDKLQKLINTYDKYINNIHGIFSSSESGSGFEKVNEQLERFYNYLRKIEEIENRLAILNSKQSILDAVNDKSLKYKKEELNLLKEQRILYQNYHKEQIEFGKELKEELLNNYSDWVYFDELGNVQVADILTHGKGLEIVNEEQQARYEAFNEVLELYTSTIQESSESSNKLLELQALIIENVNDQWSKTKELADAILETYTKTTNLLTHKKGMQFNPLIALKFDKNLLQSIREEYDQAKKLYDQYIQESGTAYARIQEAGYSDYIERQGNTWQLKEVYKEMIINNQELAEWIATLNKANENEQEMVDKMSENAEALKSQVESYIDEVVNAAQNALNEFQNITDEVTKAINQISHNEELYGTTGEGILQKIDLTVESIQFAKGARAEIEQEMSEILSHFESLDIGKQFIELIGGQKVINETAIQNAMNITEDTREQLLELAKLYKAYGEAANTANEEIYNGLSQIKTALEAQQQATIDLMQQVHDELMEEDQEEVDSLKAKYDEMTALDNAYYSSLQRRINDARKTREVQEENYSIASQKAQAIALSKDTSSKYSSQQRQSRKDLQKALQTQADNAIDREMERIQREQEERQKDRDLQIKQMENLITFKDENRMYWQQALEMWHNGADEIAAYLANRISQENISQADIQDKLGELKNSVITAFTSIFGNNFATMIDDALGAGGVVEQAMNKTANSIQSMSSLYQTEVHSISEALTTDNSAFWGIFKSAMKEVFDKSDNVMSDSTIKTLQAYIDQMEKNSKAWYQTNDQQEKNRLHAENEAIAKIVEEAYHVKLEYDQDIGKWHEKGSKITGSSYLGSGTSTSSSRNQLDNTDFDDANSAANLIRELMKSNAEAWHKATTDKERARLAANNETLAQNFNDKYGAGRLVKDENGVWWLDGKRFFSKGGLVNFTGPAIVHGTKSSPEAFLNAKQTELFAQLRDVLLTGIKSQFTHSVDNTGDSVSIGNLTIAIKEVADVDSIDKITKEVKKSIYSSSTNRGTIQVSGR